MKVSMGPAGAPQRVGERPSELLDRGQDGRAAPNSLGALARWGCRCRSLETDGPVATSRRSPFASPPLVTDWGNGTQGLACGA